ncbi:unnamed protein product [marine sediment metagenome]|uniref:Uncharacterized protein n=1 Tax=marine sediment metagenome TaxID=412755 RepID=X1JDM1_9ZZZZ
MGEEVIFRRGQDSAEEFIGDNVIKTGIKRRIKHDDVWGISLHDAKLIKDIQEGHKHTVLHEAIMLLEGKIVACWWDDVGNIWRESLSKRGDLVVFPPNLNHTLIVEEDSRVIVVKFPPNTKTDKRVKASPSPIGLENLREEILKAQGKTEKVLQRAQRVLSSRVAK